jgi:predicted dehydrogenase
MIKVGVIGYGYWGPNVARNFNLPGISQVIAIADKSEKSQKRAAEAFPNVKIVGDAQEILSNTEIDVVAVVTPVWTHFELAKAALNHGKHVFVEKPFTASVAQAEELIELAARKRLQIMVDHTFLFTGAVRKIRQLVDEGTLGNLFYYDSMRVNLGLFQHDINVIWDLAPHDLSIMDHVIQKEPEAIVATGEKHLNNLVDIAFLTIYFPGNVVAHINVNWLSPVKVRTTLIGGEKKMLVWNDLEPDEKLRVYDRGVYCADPKGLRSLFVSYRSGDMWAPKIEQTEALTRELEYFYECIAQQKQPFNDGAAGWRIVRMIEAAADSLKRRGETVNLSPTGSLQNELAHAASVRQSRLAA